MVKTQLVDDPALGRNQVKIHAVNRMGIGYTSVFEVYDNRLRERHGMRRASNGSRFWPDPVTHAMLGAARKHLFAKRS